CFFVSGRRRHTRFSRDWSSDVCSSDLGQHRPAREGGVGQARLRLAHAVAVDEVVEAPPEAGVEDLGEVVRRDVEGPAVAGQALGEVLLLEFAAAALPLRLQQRQLLNIYAIRSLLCHTI